MPFLFMQSPELMGTYPLDGEDKKDVVKAKAIIAKLVKIESVSHSMTVPVAPLRPSFNKGLFRTGTVEHNPIVVKRIVDPASISLLKVFNQQTVLSVLQILAGVPVSMKSALGKEITMAPQWILRLQSAFISNYAYQSAADGSITEDITIRYAAIGWGFCDQTNEKSLKPPAVTYIKLDNSYDSAWASDADNVKFQQGGKPPSDPFEYFTPDSW